MRKILITTFCLIAFSGLSNLSFGQAIYTWTGATDSDWDKPGNWLVNGVVPGAPPASNSHVVFNATSISCTLNTTTLIQSLTIESSYSGSIYQNGQELWIQYGLIGGGKFTMQENANATFYQNGLLHVSEDFQMLGGNLEGSTGMIRVDGDFGVFYDANFTSTQGTLLLRGFDIRGNGKMEIEGQGNFIHNGGTVKFECVSGNCTQGQSLVGPEYSKINFYNLEIDNQSGLGVSFNLETEVENELILTNGKLYLDHGHMYIGKFANMPDDADPNFVFVEGTNPDSYVVTPGKYGIRKRYHKDHNVQGEKLFFPVGDANKYAPFKIDIWNAQIPPNPNPQFVECRVKQEPSSNMDNLNPTNYLNRHWSVYVEGVGYNPGAGYYRNYEVEFWYHNSDVIGTQSFDIAHRNESLDKLTTLYSDDITGFNHMGNTSNPLSHTGNIGVFSASDVCEFSLSIVSDQWNNVACTTGVDLKAVYEGDDPDYDYDWKFSGTTQSSGIAATIPDLTGVTGVGVYSLEATENSGGAGCNAYTEIELTDNVNPNISNPGPNPTYYWTFEPNGQVGGIESQVDIEASKTLQVCPYLGACGQALTNVEEGIYSTTNDNNQYTAHLLPPQVGNYLRLLKGSSAKSVYPGNLNFDNGAFTFETLFRLDSKKMNLPCTFVQTKGVNGGVGYGVFNVEWDEFDIRIVYIYDPGTPYKEFKQFILTVPFQGDGRSSFFHYMDDNWHHMAVTFDPVEEKLSLYMDGHSPEGFSTTEYAPYYASANCIGVGCEYETWLVNSDANGQFSFGDLDEVAFYDEALPPLLIYGHYQDAMEFGQHYTTADDVLPCDMTPLENQSSPIDINEFAIGHGDPSTIDKPIDQFKTYPFPRYMPGHTLSRNFPWYGMRYLGGLNPTGLPGGNYENNGATAANNSYELNIEVADHWHQYAVLDHANPSNPSKADPNDVVNVYDQTKAFVKLAGDRPDLPLAAITFWKQLKAIQLNGNMINDRFMDYKYLSSYHYANEQSPEWSILTNPPGFPNIENLDVMNEIKIDGRVARFYFENLYHYLDRPIDIINENGELDYPRTTCATNGGHFSSDGDITADQFANTPTYNGLNIWPVADCEDSDWLAYTTDKRLDFRETFSTPMLTMPQHQSNNTRFSWYSNDGLGGHRRTMYEIIRTGTTPDINNNYYATTSFFTFRPYMWWRKAIGGEYGLKWVEEARPYELALGDNLFSPYTTAGWSYEPEVNMRPGQFLGLLKILAVYGAEFYYASFFSLQDPYPNAKNWAWQAVMPSYAQAVTSRYEDILRNGALMNDVNGEPIFNHTSSTHMDRIAIRKLNNQYLISGTLQTNSFGSADPLKKDVCVSLPNCGEMTFEIRRQGSTYLYVKDQNEPLFYQLDKWHEYKHPQRWSQDFRFEAEVHDGLEQEPGKLPGDPEYYAIRTRIISQGSELAIDQTNCAKLDLTTAFSYLNFPAAVSSNQVTWDMGDGNNRPYSEYQFRVSDKQALTKSYDFYVKARVKTVGTPETTSLDISLSDNSSQKVIYSDHIGCIDDTDWKWYRMGLCGEISFDDLGHGYYTVRVMPGTNLLEIDEIVLDIDGNFADTISIVETTCLLANGSLPLEAGFEVLTTCDGEPVQFVNKSGYVGNSCVGNGISYTWDFGDGVSSNDESPAHQYLSAGTYTVTLTLSATASYFSASTDISVGSVTVHAKPVVTLIPAGSTTFCYGNERTLNGTITGSSAPYTVEWFGTSTLHSITVPNPNFSAVAKPYVRKEGSGLNTIYHPTEYRATVTDANGCSVTPASVFLTVKEDLKVTASISNGVVDEGTPGAFPVLQASIDPQSPGTPNYDYAWGPESDGELPNDQLTGTSNTSHSTTVTGGNDGLYTYSELYTVTVTDDDGCVATANAYLHVQDPNNQPKRNLSEEEEPEPEVIDEKLRLTVYPNPFMNNTTIAYELTEDAEVDLKVFDLLGRVVDKGYEVSQKEGSYQYEFDAHGSQKGGTIYILYLRVNDRVLTRRIVGM